VLAGGLAAMVGGLEARGADFVRRTRVNPTTYFWLPAGCITATARWIGWGLGAPSSSVLGGIWRRNFLHHFDGLLTYSQAGKAEYAALGFLLTEYLLRPMQPHHVQPGKCRNVHQILAVGERK